MGAKILIVDDEVNVLRMLGYALESEGYEVVTAESGKEALAKVDAERPELMILDRMLPDMSGDEVCGQLRRQSRTGDLPIIMLSARAQVADRISGLKAGVDEYVTKPFDSDEMVARVVGLLERRAELNCGRATSDVPSEGRIVAVFGARGGVGQTVIATNLAIAMSQITKKRVVLVDANVRAGDVGVMLELCPQYTVLDLLCRIDELDDELLNDVLVSHSSGIEVLVAPDQSEVSETGEAVPLKRLLAWLRGRFDYIVVDATPFPGECALAVLGVADTALLVTTPEVPSVRKAAQFLDVAVSLDDLPALLLTILNRDDRKSGVTVKDIEQSLKCTICARVPNEYELVICSVNRGVPFLVSHRKSAVSKSLLALAETISADTDPATGVPAARRSTVVQT